MSHNNFDLAAAAREEMIEHGFDPDFPQAVEQQGTEIAANPPATNGAVRDLRQLLWSSIDNDSSRDLDQIEVAERVDGGIRIMVGIADVDFRVKTGTPVDQHAAKRSEEHTSELQSQSNLVCRL